MAISWPLSLSDLVLMSEASGVENRKPSLTPIPTTSMTRPNKLLNVGWSVAGMIRNRMSVLMKRASAKGRSVRLNFLEKRANPGRLSTKTVWSPSLPPISVMTTSNTRI